MVIRENIFTMIYDVVDDLIETKKTEKRLIRLVKSGEISLDTFDKCIDRLYDVNRALKIEAKIRNEVF